MIVSLPSLLTPPYDTRHSPLSTGKMSEGASPFVVQRTGFTLNRELLPQINLCGSTTTKIDTEWPRALQSRKWKYAPFLDVCRPALI